MEKPIKDWGKGIPQYTKEDLLHGMELHSFCIQFAIHSLQQDGYTIQGVNVKQQPAQVFASKDGNNYAIIVAGDVFPYKGRIPFAMKTAFSEFCRKQNEIPMLISIGIMSLDYERAAAELALKYDGYNALKEVEDLSVVKEPGKDDKEYREFVIEQIINAYRQGRFEKIYKYLDDKIVFRSQWVETPMNGKEELVQYFEGKGQTLRKTGSRIEGSVVALRRKHDMTQLLKMFDEKPVTCALLRQQLEKGFTWTLLIPRFNEDNIISEILLCDPARYSIKPYHAFE